MCPLNGKGQIFIFIQFFRALYILNMPPCVVATYVLHGKQYLSMSVQFSLVVVLTGKQFLQSSGLSVVSSEPKRRTERYYTIIYLFRINKTCASNCNYSISN